MLQEEGKSETTEKPITVKSPEEAYTHYFRQNRSIVDRVFVGQTETVVDCTRCSTKSVTYNAFLDLQLEIFDLSLESCLRRHFESEKIEDYEC
jgi:ubiquitin C-terminal hydrolase